jgi:hypothetical protein
MLWAVGAGVARGCACTACVGTSAPAHRPVSSPLLPERRPSRRHPVETLVRGPGPQAPSLHAPPPRAQRTSTVPETQSTQRRTCSSVTPRAPSRRPLPLLPLLQRSLPRRPNWASSLQLSLAARTPAASHMHGAPVRLPVATPATRHTRAELFSRRVQRCIQAATTLRHQLIACLHAAQVLAHLAGTRSRQGLARELGRRGERELEAGCCCPAFACTAPAGLSRPQPYW